MPEFLDKIKTYGFYALCAFIAVALVAIPLIPLWLIKKSKSFAGRTEAEITEVCSIGVFSGHLITLQYFVDGELHVGKHRYNDLGSFNCCDYEAGDKVMVRYDIQHPNRFMPELVDDEKITIGFSCFLLILTIACYVGTVIRLFDN